MKLLLCISLVSILILHFEQRLTILDGELHHQWKSVPSTVMRQSLRTSPFFWLSKPICGWWCGGGGVGVRTGMEKEMYFLTTFYLGLLTLANTGTAEWITSCHHKKYNNPRHPHIVNYSPRNLPARQWPQWRPRPICDVSLGRRCRQTCQRPSNLGPAWGILTKSITSGAPGAPPSVGACWEQRAPKGSRRPSRLFRRTRGKAVPPLIPTRLDKAPSSGCPGQSPRSLAAPLLDRSSRWTTCRMIHWESKTYRIWVKGGSGIWEGGFCLVCCVVWYE